MSPASSSILVRNLTKMIKTLGGKNIKHEAPSLPNATCKHIKARKSSEPTLFPSVLSSLSPQAEVQINTHPCYTNTRLTSLLSVPPYVSWTRALTIPAETTQRPAPIPHAHLAPAATQACTYHGRWRCTLYKRGGDSPHKGWAENIVDLCLRRWQRRTGGVDIHLCRAAGGPRMVEGAPRHALDLGGDEGHPGRCWGAHDSRRHACLWQDRRGTRASIPAGSEALPAALNTCAGDWGSFSTLLAHVHRCPSQPRERNNIAVKPASDSLALGCLDWRPITSYPLNPNHRSTIYTFPLVGIQLLLPSVSQSRVSSLVVRRKSEG